MIFDDPRGDIALCKWAFARLEWHIETESLNLVSYEGKSESLMIHVDGTLEGYTGDLVWKEETVLFSTDRSSESLTSVLEEIKTEWQKLVEVMK